MTADVIQNGPQSGSKHSFPSQVRANYDQDMPSTTLTFDGNEGVVRCPGAGKRHSPGGVNPKERVLSQDETENRKSSPGDRSFARQIKSKDGGADVQEGAHGHVLIQGGDSGLDILTFTGKIRNLPSEMDEAGGNAADELENADETETRPFMASKPQVATAASQLQQFQQSHLQYPQQGIIGGGWENFLPQRNLRVLLVEDDDSTRHVVGALLRNCGYEVASAASGLLAWELLQDKNSHFDLALTDVMLPSLSGITLLAKIMNQETCKQIPVVMMSSLDSVDIVFKCLSRGALDFLVKPVRKNELKNLWQHVWRKCHSSTGSGSGSGSQTGKVADLKNMDDIATNSSSNDNDSSSLNACGGSDNGSGTQNFWTKKAEVEGPRRTTDWEVAHLSHGAHAHAVGQTTSGVLPKDRRSSLDAIRGQATIQAKALDRVMGKNSGIAASRTGGLEFQVINNGHLKDAKQKVLPLEDVEQNERLYEDGMPDRVGATLEAGPAAIDLLGNIACQPKSKENQHCSGNGENLERGAGNSPTTKDNVFGSISLPTLELSLKRSHAVEEDGKVEDRHVLRQSGPSAFTRYSNSGAVLQQHPHFLVGGPFTLGSVPLKGGYLGHSTTPVTSMGANQIEGLQVVTPGDRVGRYKGDDAVSPSLPLHSQLASVGNNQDMNPSVVGASGQEVHAGKEEGASASGTPKSIAVPTHAILSFDGVGAFGTSRHPVFYTSSKSPWAASDRPDQGEGFIHHQFEDRDLPLQSHQQTYHHYSHHYHHHHVQHHYHHHLAHVNSGSPESLEDEQTITNPGTGAPQCGSSNMMGTVPGNLGQSGSSNGYGVTGNGNGSVNGSASGSNYGSNNHNGNSNGQSGILATAGANGDSGNNNGNSGSGNGNGISSVNGGNGSGVVIGCEQNCFTRREAALNKFRQKRKERCFEKKVRYQSRKRLAEQRPRVRGQFVRQAAPVAGIADQGHGNNKYMLAETDYDVADAECD